MEFITTIFGSVFFVVLGFVLAAVLLLEGLYLTWNAYKGPEAKRIERRLRAMAAGGGGAEASILKQRMLSESPLSALALRFAPCTGVRPDSPAIRLQLERGIFSRRYPFRGDRRIFWPRLLFHCCIGRSPRSSRPVQRCCRFFMSSESARSAC